MADNLSPNPDGTYAMPEVVWIPLSNLEPGPGYRSQLRGMDELENSIRQFGVLTPLWVQPHPRKDNCYVIFAGRRRYEAVKKIAREQCDPALEAGIAVQIGNRLLPCRVFRDLARVHEVAARVEWSGAGINLRKQRPSPSDIRDAVKEVLSNPVYRENAHRIQRDFAQYDAPKRAAELLESLAGRGSAPR